MSPDQRSLEEQIRALITLAVEAGLYDAAEWVEGRFSRSRTSRFRAEKVRQILRETFEDDS